jgi:hypothetical protein
MDRDDIIRLARESGIIQPEIVFTHLERFAALVAAAERKACAKVCDEEGLHITASIIRARGKE